MTSDRKLKASRAGWLEMKEQLDLKDLTMHDREASKEVGRRNTGKPCNVNGSGTNSLTFTIVGVWLRPTTLHQCPQPCNINPSPKSRTPPLKPYTGTSLITNRAPIGSYSRTMPRALLWS